MLRCAGVSMTLPALSRHRGRYWGGSLGMTSTFPPLHYTAESTITVSMSPVWTNSRAERHRMLHILQRYFQQVPAECCHCGRPLGLIFGDETNARHHWVN